MYRVLQYRAHRQSSDELRYETEFDQVKWLHLRKQVDIAPPVGADGRLIVLLQEAHGLLAGAPRNYLFEAHKRPAACRVAGACRCCRCRAAAGCCRAVPLRAPRPAAVLPLAALALRASAACRTV